MLLIFPPVSMQFWIETPSRLGRLATSLRWHRHPTAALRTFAQVQRCSSVGKSSKETFSPPRSVRWHSFNSSHVTPNQTFNQVKNGMLVRIIESGKTVVKSRCLHPSASQNVIFVFSIVCLPSVDVKIYAYIWLYICAYIRSISMKFLLFVSCKDIKKKICGNWASVRPKCKRCVYHASAPHPKTRHQQRYHYRSITSLLCIIPGFIRYKYLRKQDSNCERTNMPSPLLLVSCLCKWISVCFWSLYVSVPIFLYLLVLCVYYIFCAGVHDRICVLPFQVVARDQMLSKRIFRFVNGCVDSEPLVKIPCIIFRVHVLSSPTNKTKIQTQWTLDRSLATQI